VDPVPDPLLLRKSGSARNSAQILASASQSCQITCFPVTIVNLFSSVNTLRELRRLRTSEQSLFYINMIGVHPACVLKMFVRDIFNVIIVYISHLMMAQEGRNM
jgi:hypothetical protein